MLIDFNVKGRTIVITGGAGGIGSVTAKALAEHGMNIAIVDVVDEKETDELIRTVKAEGVECRYYKCDVSNRQEVRNLSEQVIMDFNNVDVLFNNAAYCRIILLEQMTDEYFDETVNVSLRGCFICSQEFGKYMIKRGKGGTIISTASLAAIVGLPRGTSHHSAAKAGICGLTRSMALEWAKYNIRCNVIVPGQVGTSSLMRLMENEQYKKEIMDNIPLKRVGKSEEIAAAVLYLSSDMGLFITGQMFVIDGGYSIH
jgi:NAD(P)-dependent dehydrogenase (short-subunit alcohol dehydrogenase family)